MILSFPNVLKMLHPITEMLLFMLKVFQFQMLLIRFSTKSILENQKLTFEKMLKQLTKDSVFFTKK